jgi:hypothetical protein
MSKELRSPSASGYQGFDVKRALAITAMAIGLVLGAGTECSAQYLTGSARENYIKGTTSACMRTKANSEETKTIPNSLFEGNCRCYANALADKITVADMQSGNTAVTGPILKAAAATCYQAMKAEALGLYRAGQYPKQ